MNRLLFKTLIVYSRDIFATENNRYLSICEPKEWMFLGHFNPHTIAFIE